MGQPPSSLGLTAWLDRLPIPVLVLDAGGSVLAANAAWATLWPQPADGQGWLNAVEPAFRLALGARLRLAAAAAEPGCVDCPVTGPDGGRWSRWSWQPIPDGMIVCVAVLDDGQARVLLPVRADTGDPPAQASSRPAVHTAISADVAMAVVHRIFEAGLALESAASLLGAPMATLVLRILDDLDQLVRDIRNQVFKPQAPALPPPPEE
jgi:hypothetical protein